MPLASCGAAQNGIANPTATPAVGKVNQGFGHGKQGQLAVATLASSRNIVKLTCKWASSTTISDLTVKKLTSKHTEDATMRIHLKGETRNSITFFFLTESKFIFSNQLNICTC